MMKNFLRLVLPLFALLLCATGASAQTTARQKTVYMFAYGTSLTDSVAYVSAVTAMPTAEVENKTGFLVDRAFYAAQFKGYLERTYAKPHATAVFFAEKRADVEKKFLKLRNQYGKRKRGTLVEVPETDFKLASLTTAEAQ